MNKPSLPPWWPKARPFVGVLLTMLLITVVALRATGVTGGDAEPTDDGTLTAANEETTPYPEPAVIGTDEPSPSQVSPTQDATKEPKPRKPRRDKPGRAGGVDPDLIKEIESLLSTGGEPSEAPEPPAEPAVFRVSSFNVLGHSHTTARGNKPQFAESPQRMRWAVQVLRGYDIDVVGFQEFEMPQLQAFRRTAGGWDAFPGASLGRNAVRNSIAWRLDTWKLVSAKTIKIPYFRGHRVPMPFVLLEHVATGQRVFFSNVHLPASRPGRGNNEPWRDMGTRLQIQLAKQLRAKTQLPVILMGDFNERAEVFCKIAGPGGMVAANGGSGGPPCRPPAGHGIDWIFGTRDISFSDYLKTRSGLVSRATDHPIIMTTAQVG